MPDNTTNTQIGGTYHGPVGLGQHVTMHVNQAAGSDDLRTALADLRRLLAAHAVDPRAGRDVDDIEAEASHADPDPDRIRDALARLAGRVGAVGTLVAAVARVGELVQHGLH